MFLEKGGAEVDDQKFFEKLSDHTSFVAKELPLCNDDMETAVKHFPYKGFKGITIRRFSKEKNIGMKISGKYRVTRQYLFLGIHLESTWNPPGIYLLKCC